MEVNAFGDCIINGPGGTCALATNTYTATPATNVSSLTYSWLITNDTAATVFLGNTNSASVQVLSATNGAFLLQCTVRTGTNSNFQTLCHEHRCEWRGDITWRCCCLNVRRLVQSTAAYMSSERVENCLDYPVASITLGTFQLTVGYVV